MAIAVGEIQLTINEKFPLGGGRAIYKGVCTGGTEYPQSTGASLGEEATNSRYKLPERWDVFQIEGGAKSVLVDPNHVKLMVEGTVVDTVSPLVALKDKASMATAGVSASPFWGIGLK